MKDDEHTINSQIPNLESLDRIIRLTSLTVWHEKIAKSHINKWLENFNGEVYSKKAEEKLALWLLTHFTYYNFAEIKHLCKTVYLDFLHFILNDQEPDTTLSNNIGDFFEKTAIISHEITSGSGGMIAYFFRHVNSLPMPCFKMSLDDVNDTDENIVVIDDTTLSASSMGQSFDFWKQVRLKYPSKKLFMLTLVSSDESKNFFWKEFKLKIISAITLDKRDKCFDPDSYIFENKREVQELCKKFASHYGEKVSRYHPLGYNKGEYTFCFFYNTPDNTLPIFWSSNSNWNPIFTRYGKIEDLQRVELPDVKYL